MKSGGIQGQTHPGVEQNRNGTKEGPMSDEDRPK
ncbi:hypothetical protein PspLS_01435 [Pyricularia sp. CBS 133598]|nr:hypothetical protein PspLS_01435 [Pyricularia sp. CBS 133598]